MDTNENCTLHEISKQRWKMWKSKFAFVLLSVAFKPFTHQKTPIPVSESIYCIQLTVLNLVLPENAFYYTYDKPKQPSVSEVSFRSHGRLYQRNMACYSMHTIK